MGLSGIKQATRLGIHARMAEPCTYSRGEIEMPTEEQVLAGLELTARFHTKSKLHRADDDGVAIMEPIEKLVFNSTQLEALGLELEQGAIIHFPAYDVSVELDSELDGDGPENVYWTTTRA